MNNNSVFFLNLHAYFHDAPSIFKKEVCQACGWSEATYYRKVKVGGQFTEAEKDAIIAIGKRLAKKGAALVKG